MACANPPAVALPETVTGPLRGCPARKNCTVPVGSCDAFATALLWVPTVAVRATVCPAATVIGLAETVVVVLAFVTVTVTVALLVVKLLSPA